MKYVKKKIELKENLSGREVLDTMQEVELYLSSNGLQKGWENVKEICEKRNV